MGTDQEPSIYTIDGGQKDVSSLEGTTLKKQKKNIQIVFQVVMVSTKLWLCQGCQHK